MALSATPLSYLSPASTQGSILPLRPESELQALTTDSKTPNIAIVTTKSAKGDNIYTEAPHVYMRGVKGGDMRRAADGSCLACHRAARGSWLVVCRQLPTDLLAARVWRVGSCLCHSLKIGVR